MGFVFGMLGGCRAGHASGMVQSIVDVSGQKDNGSFLQIACKYLTCGGHEQKLPPSFK